METGMMATKEQLVPQANEVVALLANTQTATAEQYATAETVESVGKKMAKTIEDFFAPHIKRAHDNWKALIADRDSHLKPVNDALGALRGRMRDYLLEEDRKQQARLAEERKAQEALAKAEEDKRLAAAEALEKAGMGELAAAVVAQDAPAPAPVPKAEPLAAASGLRSNWKAVVTDRMALIRAIAEGRVVEDPMDLIIFFNETKLNSMARRIQEEREFLPGVKAFNDKKLATRGK